MSMAERADQFQPFRAPTGYEDAIQETARVTDSKVELIEDEKAFLDVELQKLADNASRHPLVTVTYFQPDKKKTGGAYISVTGQLEKIDEQARVLVLVGEKRILIEDVLNIQ